MEACAKLTAAVLGVLPLQLLGIFQRLPHRQLIRLVPPPIRHALAPRRHRGRKSRHLVGDGRRKAAGRRLRRGGCRRRCRGWSGGIIHTAAPALLLRAAWPAPLLLPLRGWGGGGDGAGATAACGRLLVSKPAGTAPWPPLLVSLLRLLLPLGPAAAARARAAAVAAAGSGHGGCRSGAGASCRGGAAGYYARREAQGLTNMLHGWGAAGAHKRWGGGSDSAACMLPLLARVQTVQHTMLETSERMARPSGALRGEKWRLHAGSLDLGLSQRTSDAFQRPTAPTEIPVRRSQWRSQSPTPSLSPRLRTAAAQHRFVSLRLGSAKI